MLNPNIGMNFWLKCVCYTRDFYSETTSCTAIASFLDWNEVFLEIHSYVLLSKWYNI